MLTEQNTCKDIQKEDLTGFKAKLYTEGKTCTVC